MDTLDLILLFEGIASTPGVVAVFNLNDITVNQEIESIDKEDPFETKKSQLLGGAGGSGGGTDISAILAENPSQ